MNTCVLKTKTLARAIGAVIALSAASTAISGNNWRFENLLPAAEADKFGGLAIGLLNADSTPDIVITTESGVEIFLQTPDGLKADEFPDARFASSTALAVSGGGVRSVVIGDFNGDQSADLAVGARDNVSLFFGDGAGGFAAPIEIAAEVPNSAATADYAEDSYNSKVDFGADSNADNDVFFTETAAYKDYASGVEGLAAIDRDGDGDLDLVTDQGEAGLWVYDNDGAGGFTKDAAPLDAESNRFGDNVTVADVDVDGYVDLIARRNIDADYLATADFYKNNGSAFNGEDLDLGSLPVTGFSGFAEDRRKPGGVAACDLDGDGYLDMVSTAPRGHVAADTTQAAQGLNVIYPWDSANEKFDSPINLAANSEDQSGSGAVVFSSHDQVSCGDFDNDGDLDIWLGRGSQFDAGALFENNGGFNFTQHLGAKSPDLSGQDSAPYQQHSTAAAYSDLDLDGDLDLVINAHCRQPAVWVNTTVGAYTTSDSYLVVRPRLSAPVAMQDPAIGSTVRLYSCSGGSTSASAVAVRQISGGGGRGSQNDQIAHFAGLYSGETYAVEVIYPGNIKTYDRVVVGGFPSYQGLSTYPGQSSMTKSDVCDTGTTIAPTNQQQCATAWQTGLEGNSFTAFSSTDDEGSCESSPGVVSGEATGGGAMGIYLGAALAALIAIRRKIMMSRKD